MVLPELTSDISFRLPLDSLLNSLLKVQYLIMIASEVAFDLTADTGMVTWLMRSF